LKYNNRRNWNQRRQNTESKGQGIYVEVRNGDAMKAIRIFKKKVQEEGIIQEYRERQHYVKPSEKKRKAKQAGRKRWLKKLEKQQAERGY
tara:strand:- start:1186 stop:1455 length:270 start_codon:yes stop_codon:yes gene_type:complete